MPTGRLLRYRGGRQGRRSSCTSLIWGANTCFKTWPTFVEGFVLSVMVTDTSVGILYMRIFWLMALSMNIHGVSDMPEGSS